MKDVSSSYPEYLPDHFFKKYCLENYGVNKGVCNTIDEMFYRQGVYDVASRRSMILDFLSYRNDQTENKKSGAGTLSNLVNEFLNVKLNNTSGIEITD